jgi:hypothetical protein
MIVASAIPSTALHQPNFVTILVIEEFSETFFAELRDPRNCRQPLMVDMVTANRISRSVPDSDLRTSLPNRRTRSAEMFSGRLVTKERLNKF